MTPTDRISRELFKNPPAEYRGAPFWSWNNKLDQQQLLRQIGYFQEMGFGGFNIHPRTGLATAYLGAEFMEMIRICVEEAQRRNIRCWLYDEDRWPSGYAGGLVTGTPEFRAQHLLWTATPYGGRAANKNVDSSAVGTRNENGVLLGRYEVILIEGRLASYRRLADRDVPAEGATLWYAYRETAVATSWFNNQTYGDTLNPAAMRRFIEVTHERYRATVGSHFGSTIPAIFTDEP